MSLNILLGNKTLKAFSIFIILLAILQWSYFVFNYSENILFYDQWDFYNSHFDNSSYLSSFLCQHGPHRQGIGFVFQRIIDQWTDWNSFYSSIVIGFLIVATAISYFFLAKHFNPTFNFFFCSIFLVALLPTQEGIFTGSQNFSHGATPALLISLYALCFTIKDKMLLYSLLVIINFNLLFSGFGLFIGIITPVLLCLQIIQSLRSKQYSSLTFYSILLLLALASWILFFNNYFFSPATEDFKFPHDKPLEYLLFIVFSYNKALGFDNPTLYSLPITLSILLGALYVFFTHTVAIYQNTVKNTEISRLSLIIVSLIGFSFLFSINCAIGRVGMSIRAGEASRYAPYLVPSLIAIFLHIQGIKSESHKIKLNSAYFLLVISANLFCSENIREMKLFQEWKSNWKEFYFLTQDINLATQLNGGKAIYPWPEQTHLKEKIKYLRDNNLNFFLDIDHPKKEFYYRPKKHIIEEKLFVTNQKYSNNPNSVARWEVNYEDVNFFSCSGWALTIGINSEKLDKYIVFANAERNIHIPLVSTTRKDVTNAVNDNINYDLSGFELFINKNILKNYPGVYNIGVLLKGKKDTSIYYSTSDKFISIVDSILSPELFQMDSSKNLVATGLWEFNILNKYDLMMDGWAFPSAGINKYRTSVLLKNYNNPLIVYRFPTNIVFRPDVTASLNNGLNYDSSGFHQKVRLDKMKIEPGYYRSGIYIENDLGKYWKFSQDSIYISVGKN